MKTKKTTLLVFILGLFIQVTAQTTGIIKGVVHDKTTQQTLPGATVYFKGTTNGTSTDTSGAFSFKSKEEGIYSIVVSYVGYQEKTINDVQVLRNKTNFLDIEIEEIAIALKDVTITAFKSENNRIMPVSSYGFSREEISRNPGAQGDIFRAIGMLPGVSSSGGEYSAIAVRGQGTGDNVYIVDDIPVTNLSHLEGLSKGFDDPNGGRFSMFASRVIDNAEFQGGGFAAEYGRRSASYLGLGIKEGNNENPIIDGQLDLMGLTINYDGPSYLLKNTSLFVSARYQNFKPVETLTGLLDLGIPKYQDFIFKSTSKIGAKNKLSVIGIYSPETYLRTTENVKEDKELKNTFVAETHDYKAIMGISLGTLTGKNSYLKNIVYYTNITKDDSYGYSFPKTDESGNLIDEGNIPYEKEVKKLEYTEFKIGFRSMFSLRFANNSKLASGIDLDRIDIDNYRNLSRIDTFYVFNTNDIRPDPNLYYTLLYPQYFNVNNTNFAYNASAYCTYSFFLFDKLSINAGLRYDYSGFTDEHNISPRLSGSYQLNATDNINFATGIFYQDPSNPEIADQPSSKKLKEEQVIQFIIGYKKYITPDLKLTVESWYKSFDNLIVRPVDGQVEQNNSGTGHAYGVDVNLTKRLTNRIHGQIGYSYMQSKRDDHDGFGEYDFDFSQPHQVNFLISYQPNQHWVLALKCRYATGKPKDGYIIHNNIFDNPGFIRYSQEITSNNSSRLPDFLSFDVRADYRFRIHSINLTAFVDIVDILNRQNVNSEGFNNFSGTTYYDGISIFPSFGIKFQL